jgi:hypothetical protein
LQAHIPDRPAAVGKQDQQIARLTQRQIRKIRHVVFDIDLDIELIVTGGLSPALGYGPQ